MLFADSICFNLSYGTCRGPFEQQCIRYLTSNVCGSGPIRTGSSARCVPVRLVQGNSEQLQQSRSEGNARIMVLGEQRR